MAEEEIFQFEEAFLPKSSTSSSDHLQLLSSKGLTTRIDCDRTVSSSSTPPSSSSVDRIATSIAIPATSTAKRPPTRPVSLELGPRNELAASCGRPDISASNNTNNNNNSCTSNNNIENGGTSSNGNYNTSPTGAASKIIGMIDCSIWWLPDPDSAADSQWTYYWFQFPMWLTSSAPAPVAGAEPETLALPTPNPVGKRINVSVERERRKGSKWWL